MNVLLLEHDLYKSVGGGQTVYKRLIESNPGIDFHYLGREEAANASRPPNAHFHPYQAVYAVQDLTGEFADLDVPMASYLEFIEASNVAASVAHLHIDVVDAPDYKIVGYLLGPALQRHGQKSCRVALALHGNLSETQQLNWATKDEVHISVDQREQWQYRAADIRYGISRDYVDHWRDIAGCEAQYLNPLRFFRPPQPVKWERSGKGVDLNFIGRTEGTKGPDLFVELLAWLPAGSYRTARIIGPSVADKGGTTSREYLRQMMFRRGLEVQFHPCMNQEEMAGVYAMRGITVLPSRLDTLNLIALESLFSGCPVAVSDKAGVCRFLRETYPDIPFTTLRVDHLYTAAPALEQLMKDYVRQRDRLAAALGRAAPVITGPSLAEIYETGDAQPDTFLRQQAFALYDRLALFHRRIRTPVFERLTTAGVRTCEALRRHVEGAKPKHPARESDLWSLYRDLFYLKEATPAEINQKVTLCRDISLGSRLDRTRIWSELARLERMRGNDFVAATYEVRILRAMGGDRKGMLPWVMSVLTEHGYPQEAETVLAMYGPPEERMARCRALLERARAGHREVPDRPFEFVEDTRRCPSPRASVIVSLYKAANKLETFLRMLAQHPWVQTGQVELVFVDSHSPTDEHAVFTRVAAELQLTAIYARTAERETIQKAWNRGIRLTRAPYLSFLGVDEMVRPDTFSLLAGELDANPTLDWVQGSSVMTEVNMHGTHQRDVLVYMRTPYAQDLVYLDTCYLSWVGAMYRKNMHDRLGYYDETFGAAGDTEFKNRVLPFIKSKTLPVTLGVFLNYPEERATQSPRAEIEDLRAWYLHRSVAGAEYALARRSATEALGLLTRALGYRKSFCSHQSSDLDYALAVATHARERFPGLSLGRTVAAIDEALQAYRDLDWLPVVSPRAATKQRERAGRVAAAQARFVQSVLGLRDPIRWTVFNDNRYEQHSNVWDAKPLPDGLSLGARAAWCRGRTPLDVRILDAAMATPPELPSLQWTAERLVSGLGAAGENLRKNGKPEIAQDVQMIASAVQEIAAGKAPSSPTGTSAGAVLSRVLAESHAKTPLSGTAAFDPAFASLCGTVAEIAGPLCPALGDAFEGLAAHVTETLEQTRAMEVAARLMTYKSPAEAVLRHKKELTRRVWETLQLATDAARTSGNSAYAARLGAVAAAVQTELATRGQI